MQDNNTLVDNKNGTPVYLLNAVKQISTVRTSKAYWKFDQIRYRDGTLDWQGEASLKWHKRGIVSASNSKRANPLRNYAFEQLQCGVMWHVMCRAVSCFMSCVMSYVMWYVMSHIWCHVSCVVGHVMCFHVSCIVTCHFICNVTCRVMWYHVKCHVSCHLSCVMWFHVSCHM